MSETYQLTKYPIGSKREIWTMAWPLMAAFVSTSFMLFVDRLFLAHYDPMALNAAASAGTAYNIFLVLPMGIAAIAEVLVGRIHGKEQFSEVGSATWQMIWFAVFLTPFFLFISWVMPSLLFLGTGNEWHETTYFQTLMLFAPAQCVTIAIGGFFIGIGKVKIVTIAALLGNIVNVALGYFLIFGWGSIPSFGIMGAACATGISQIIQVIFLFSLFWSRNNRKTYKTQNFSLNRSYLFEGLLIGTPSGLAHSMEIFAHFLFFRIVMSVSPEHMTLVAMVQSLYLLFSFVCEAESKAASAIVANLLGAKEKKPIGQVLLSSISLHAYFFLALVGSIFFFPNFFLQLFASPLHQELLSNPSFAHTFWWALFYICLFFLFDGWGWIVIGFLTAAGDTRFVLLVSFLIHWIAYVLPTWWFVGMQKGGAETACSIIAAMGFLSFLTYLWRYRSGVWLRAHSFDEQLS